MLTSLDCLPCLLKQALFTVRRATESVALQEKVMAESSRLLAGVDFKVSPPENSTHLYKLIAELTDCPDPFIELKEASNRLALELRPHQADLILASEDSLLTAIKLAIAGNVIDYGAHHRFDAQQTIAHYRSRPLAINHYEEFQQDLDRGQNVLYLADNCGELVFDGLLIERLGKHVVLAVKSEAIINDALLADARDCGLDRLCQVITNGTACPGTPLAHCSPSFLEAFHQADLIISKGQGNFETLSTIPAPLYFLLTVKCSVVASHITALSGVQVRIGDRIFLKSPK